MEKKYAKQNKQKIPKTLKTTEKENNQKLK